MKRHVYNKDCWCKPIILQLCLECLDADTGYMCWRCGGACLIPIYDNEHIDSIVIIHDHTISDEFEKHCESDITHTFMGPLPWQRIIMFFSKGKHI
jgi:hypothetical protein